MTNWISILSEQWRSLLRGDAAAVLSKFKRWRRSRFARIESLRIRLLSLGFTEEALRELTQISRQDPHKEVRAEAARTLALWHMGAECRYGWSTALSHLEQAKRNRCDAQWRRNLAVQELLCHFALGNAEEGRRVYSEIAKLGRLPPDVLLASANFQHSPEARVEVFNQVLTGFGMSPVGLSDDNHLPPLDRLLAQGANLPTRCAGPLVSVIVTFDAPGFSLPAVLNCLREQTWNNLQIIVVDDGRLAPATYEIALEFAASDARIQVARMPEAAEVYSARNYGLDLAKGEFVALHDTGDWSHPQRLETQVRFLIRHPEALGCTTASAVCSQELTFTWGGPGANGLIEQNFSSLMFRREPVHTTLGYWDSVRRGADEELIQRIRAIHGKDAVHFLQSGPYSLVRKTAPSAEVDRCWLRQGEKHFGARRLYREIYAIHHNRSSDLHYGNAPASRPFPVPRPMRVTQAEAEQVVHYDVIIASDFRLKGGSTQSNLQEIACQKRAGLRTALLPMYRYDYLPTSEQDHPINPAVWELVDGERVNILAYGERASCDLLIVRYPPVLQHHQNMMPRVDAKDIRVIINQAPMSDYGPAGVVRYDMQKCAENIRSYFGKDAIWHPIGPLVREALLKQHARDLPFIRLSEHDWLNIIDVDEWDRGGRKRGPREKLRIGRHARDDVTKWPDKPVDLLAAYPSSADVEVHILGGARAPLRLLGEIPKNWLIHEFGTMNPKAFLEEIDVFVYFTNPSLIESFGRSILEAMAAGVPVILPEDYRPLFGESAIYATPQTAVSTARKLHQNPVAYGTQVKRSQAYVREQFGFAMHLQRLADLGVSIPYSEVTGIG